MAFTMVEQITRQGGAITRNILPYAEFPDAPERRLIEQPRGLFAGLGLEATRIMGIVNVTPDSFSDGGRHGTAAAAIAHGRRLADEGADILDVGGESTRPGSDAVPVAAELERVVPVVSALAGEGKRISVDTRKGEVMRAGVAAGAVLINDVSALQFDVEGLAIIADLGVPAVLMHAQGDPRTMQLNPVYDNVVLDVYDQLEARVAACLGAGIAPHNIAVDPGIGFGKTYRHNVELLRELTIFHGLGVLVLLGLSRKAFIGALTGERLAVERVNGSVGGAVLAALAGIHILRVHDVKATVQALAVVKAGLAPGSTEF
jgi:dihydropteroate synthase